MIEKSHRIRVSDYIALSKRKVHILTNWEEKQTICNEHGDKKQRDSWLKMYVYLIYSLRECYCDFRFREESLSRVRCQ